MRRRDWLAAAAGAVVAVRSHRAHGASPELPPTSVAQALDQLETLLSPEALAAFYAATEDDAREFYMGVWHIYLSRGWYPGPADHVPSLAKEMTARQVPASKDFLYLLTVLWRRKHGLTLDTPPVLESIERQERRHDKIRSQNVTLIDERETFLWMPVVNFDAGSAKPRPDTDTLDYVVKEMQKPSSVCTLAQVQGHARPDEPHAQTLSLARARAVVARLVKRGVDPARLAAHGLGTRFPKRDEGPGPPAPAGDQRVEIFCLRRHWVPYPPAPPR